VELRALDWNVIIPGSWNVSIFTPRFVAKEILGLDELKLEVYVPLSTGGATVYRLPDTLEIQPGAQRLVVSTSEATKTSFENVRGKARSVLELLGRTPISAVGFNLVFRQDTDQGRDLSNYRSDFARIDGELNVDVQEWSSTVTYPYRDGFVNVILRLTGGQYEHEINFHRPTEKVEEAISWLQIPFDECYEFIQSYLASLYQEDVKIKK